MGLSSRDKLKLINADFSDFRKIDNSKVAKFARNILTKFEGG
jgi:hypothetical protein